MLRICDEPAHTLFARWSWFPAQNTARGTYAHPANFAYLPVLYAQIERDAEKCILCKISQNFLQIMQKYSTWLNIKPILHETRPNYLILSSEQSGRTRPNIEFFCKQDSCNRPTLTRHQWTAFPSLGNNWAECICGYRWIHHVACLRLHLFPRVFVVAVVAFNLKGLVPFCCLFDVGAFLPPPVPKSNI